MPLSPEQKAGRAAKAALKKAAAQARSDAWLAELDARHLLWSQNPPLSFVQSIAAERVHRTMSMPASTGEKAPRTPVKPSKKSGAQSTTKKPRDLEAPTAALSASARKRSHADALPAELVAPLQPSVAKRLLKMLDGTKLDRVAEHEPAPPSARAHDSTAPVAYSQDDDDMDFAPATFHEVHSPGSSVQEEDGKQQVCGSAALALRSSVEGLQSLTCSLLCAPACWLHASGSGWSKYGESNAAFGQRGS
jgi:hypothetical protein